MPPRPITSTIPAILIAITGAAASAQPALTGPDVETIAPTPVMDPSLVPPVDFDATGPGGVCPDPGGGNIVYKNILTGQVKEFKPVQIDHGILDADFESGSFDYAADEAYMRNFGSLSEVADPTIYPWRVNCKLIMEWYDSNGNFQGSGSCSGTLIDGRHVLTANHCTFDRDGLGWADKVFVYPAYDETDADPFGVSQAVGIIGWTGYTNNGDWNYDMSVVILDRPIGGITGWHGYGFTTSCSFFTGNTFNNASYPAESAYGFDGQQMYFRSGTFDACTETNLKKYNSLAYKGMSGSSAYYIDGNSNRYAYAVTSHRRSNGSSDCNATWCTYLTAMWSDFFYYTRDTLIPGTYGSSVDLYPMWVGTSSSTLVGGTPAGSFDYWVYNNSDVSFNGTVAANIHLSTNNTISSADPQLGTLSFGWATGPRGSVNPTYTNTLTIPNNFTTEGYYYLGALLTNSDADTSNNDTSGQEARYIYFDAKPDLDVISVNATNGTYNHLDSIPVAVSVKNDGGDDSAGYTIEIRASLNTTISTGDPLLLSYHAGSISPFQTENFSFNALVPQTLTPGTYYIGVIVSSDTTEYSTSNNTGYDATAVTITDLPDLEVVSVAATDGSYSEGDTLPVTFIVTNVGTETSSTYDFKVRASLNTLFTDFDPTIDELTGIGALTPGQSRTINRNIPVPGGIDPGDYYIGVTVTTATDADTVNNVNYDSATVEFTDDCIADFNSDGTVNTVDVITYLNAWNAKLPSADINGDGTVNTVDFIAFLNLWNAGC